MAIRRSIIFIGLLFLAASAAQAVERPVPSGTLRVVCHIAMPWVVGNQVVEPLLGVDDDNRFVPLLAASLDYHDTYVDIHLKEGVLFHDGTPFDASSIKMNWNAYQKTANPYLTADLRLGVRDVEVLSPLLVRMWFTDNPPSALIPVLLRSFYIYSPSWFVFSKGVYPPGNQGNLSVPGPWGTGPFILDGSEENDRIVTLRANPHYREPDRPRVQTIVFYGAQKVDSVSAHRMIRACNVDIFDAMVPSLILPAAQSPCSSFVVKHPLSCLTTLFNMRKPGSPLRDIRVRKALNLLIDRHTLFKYMGRGQVQLTPFVFPLSYSGEHLQPYPYDPERAHSLLAGAGFAAPGSLRITIGYSPSEKKLACAIASMLEEHGIQVAFQEYGSRYEWYGHVMEYAHGPDNPMEREEWDMNIVNTGLYTGSVATHFGESFVTGGGYRWILPDFRADELFWAAIREKDAEQMETSLFRMEEYLYTRYYMMPIFISPAVFAVHGRIAGNSFSASGYLLNLKEIRIDDAWR